MSLFGKVFGPSDLQEQFLAAQDLSINLKISDIKDAEFSNEKLYLLNFDKNVSISIDFRDYKVSISNELAEKVFNGITNFTIVIDFNNRYNPIHKLVNISNLKKPIILKVFRNEISLSIHGGILFVLRRGNFKVTKFK